MPILRSWAFVLLFLPAMANAEEEDHGFFFWCTLNEGQNSVFLSAKDDRVTYAYIKDSGQLELRLETTLETMPYRPFPWDEQTIRESVTFYNGVTSYEVFASLGSYKPFESLFAGLGDAEAGIVVTLPSGSQTTLYCDDHTISPRNPIAGIGQLAKLANPDHDPLLHCLSGSVPATACLGIVSDLYGVETGLSPRSLVFLQAEQKRWEILLAAKVSEATEMTQARFPDRAERLTTDLMKAQDSWAASRNADCDLAAWTVFDVMDEDAGKLQCLSHYAAQRIDFLNQHIAGLEFDG
ncbi:hypothetical protein AADZ90_015685 [Aestuariibius sp. 2305UL40-4]|uniref:hypothetical protein n=1 Tax=Aestuariibius violaceus TaxID=3234132 RepID=UPI00345E6BA6